VGRRSRPRGRGGPYRQSARGANYARAWQHLEQAGLAYPCYCTPLELEAARRTQLAAGRPPRYPGTCAQLSAPQRAARALRGEPSTLRFRVVAGREVVYQDLVRGAQRFASDDLGDFVIRRADGTAAFLFCNALDDAEMGVTDVLRGEDHVANTPRQRLLLEALGLAPPRYGHLPLLVGSDGAPLAKRTGSASVAAIRAAGYLPEAVVNLLVRLGHSYPADGWLDAEARIGGFDLAALGHAPAHFDAAQLRHWQHEAVQRAPSATLEGWVRDQVPGGAQAAFVAAVRANLVLPQDAVEWARVVYGELPEPGAEALAAMRAAGRAYFDCARAAAAAQIDYAALIGALKTATGRRGRELYQPLRAALTHRLDGPELAALLAVLPAANVRARLEMAAALAAAPPATADGITGSA
jgi:nondiscriminating glutamyl-tRNA synthetase